MELWAYLLKIEQAYPLLIENGIEEDEASRLIEEAQVRFEHEVKKLGNEAIEDVVRKGVANFDTKFLEDIRDVDTNTFEITTLSGRTDYSISPYSMRESLLKNAKISKTGSRYKVIPVGTRNSDRQMDIPFSIEEVQKVTAKILMEGLAERRARRGVETLKPQFRTVSDKQPIDSWTHPGFKRDYQNDLKEVNDALRLRVEDLFREIYHELITPGLFSGQVRDVTIPEDIKSDPEVVDAWYKDAGFHIRSKLTSYSLKEQLARKKLSKMNKSVSNNVPNSTDKEDEEE